MPSAIKVLVTGGVRSGKSTYAERLLRDQAVLYVAPGPTAADEPDPDWAARIAAHQARRPATWTTLETADVASALREADGPVLVDCLGTWLTAVLDRAGWDVDPRQQEAVVAAETDELVAAVEAAEHPLVLVTNEVGFGVVPEHRSGRLFRDHLGTVNQRVGAVCDDVVLMVAGRSLVL